MNFQMFELNIEKAEEPEIKLLTPLDHRKSMQIPEKHPLVSMTMLKPLTVWITTNWKILRDGNTRPPYLPPEKPVYR